MRCLLPLLVLTACAHVVAPPPSVETDPSPAPPFGPLPSLVRPTRYALEFDVDPRQERFSGRARIALASDAPSAHLFLHARGLAFASMRLEAGGETLPAHWTDPDANDLVRIDLARPVSGSATLDVTWSAPFGTQAEGLFRVEAGGAQYAYTQLESIYARRVFPCFDEPGFKTPFEVTLTVAGDDAAVSNAPEAEVTHLADGRRRVRFVPTPPLPTYLVFVAAGPLDKVEGVALPPTSVRDAPVPLRAFAVRGQGAKLAFALANVRPLLESLEARLGAYPFAKLDLLAVPNFAAGAMENPGAITFREWLLLVDEAHAPTEQRRAFRSVAAHELAHQWFGNLVTMPWWDDLWLNESFATWMEARVVSDVEPASRADDEALAWTRELMAEDSLGATRRIREPIASHHDIESAFDGITYGKGARVLSMFERWMGPGRFAAAVRRHLDRHAGGHATATELLAALSEEAGRDVAGPLATFLDQPGVPRVRVERRCESGVGTLKLTTSRWRPIGSPLPAEGRWQVPVCWVAGGGQGTSSGCALVDGAAEVRTPAGCAGWVLPNARS